VAGITSDFAQLGDGGRDSRLLPGGSGEWFGAGQHCSGRPEHSARVRFAVSTDGFLGAKSRFITNERDWGFSYRIPNKLRLYDTGRRLHPS
jgi:hypothetical protein